MESGGASREFQDLIEEQLRSLKDKLIARHEAEKEDLRAEIRRLKAEREEAGQPPTSNERSGGLRAAGMVPQMNELLGLQKLQVPGVPDTVEKLESAEPSPCPSARTDRKRGISGASSRPNSRPNSRTPSKNGTKDPAEEETHKQILNDLDIDNIKELHEAANQREENKRKYGERMTVTGMGRILVRRWSALHEATMTYLLGKDQTSLVKLRLLTVKTVSSPIFDSLIGVIILAHSICIGVETSHAVKYQTNESPVAVSVLDKIFLFIYIVEINLRFFAYGIKASMRSHWVKFDAFLVISGIVDMLVNTLPVGSLPGLDDIMLIRVLRISRLARTARLMVQFRTLWMLVQGLMHSVLTLLWTLLIMFVLCYIFAILGMEIFAQNPDEYGEPYATVVRENFGNLVDAMVTMFQFLTLDSVAGIHRPLIRERPVTAMYFIAFVLLTPIALMNLVTAIMVESSLNQSNQDQEARRAWEAQTRRNLLPKLTRLFAALDEDGSGEVDLDEIHSASTELQDQMRAVCNGADLDDIFHQLDYDASGSVSIDEFCEGLLKAGSDKPVEFHCIMRQCTDIINNSRKTQAMLESIVQPAGNSKDEGSLTEVHEIKTAS